MFIRFSTNFHGLPMFGIMREHLTSDFLENYSGVFWAVSVPEQNRVQDRLSSPSLSAILVL